MEQLNSKLEILLKKLEKEVLNCKKSNLKKQLLIEELEKHLELINN